MATRHELGRSGGQNCACDYAHVYADQRGEHIASLARDVCGFHARRMRHVNDNHASLQTSLEAMKRHDNTRARTRRSSSEETKLCGERSRANE